MLIKRSLGLKFKMDTFTTGENQECQKPKGINKNIVVKDYKNVVFNTSYMAHEKNKIQSKNHNIKTYRINSISLSCYDATINKYILENGYSRLSHFYKSTRQLYENNFV